MHDTIEKASKNIGTHSIRKGAATFASSGSTGGPSIVSICLRCGWALGNVLERYFKYEDAGDQFVGRVIAGLPVNTSKFSVLPPHFVDLESSCVKRGIQAMFPALSTVPQLSSILYLLLASLVYHFDFLHSTLPADHAFRFTPLFTDKDLLSSLRNVLVSGYESPYLVATGIPPHVEVYKLLEKNERSISKMPTLIMNGIAQVIEDKGVKAGHITRDILESVLKSALSKICPTS